MPTCIAFGCANTTGRLNTKKGFFQVPKPTNEQEKLRAARWLHNIGTGFTVNTFRFSKEKKICEDHFHPDCFVRNFQAELMGYTGKKQLVPGAVPTIFKYRTYEQINMDGTMASSRKNSDDRIKRIQVNQELSSLLTTPTVTEDLSNSSNVQPPRKKRKLVLKTPEEPPEEPLVLQLSNKPQIPKYVSRGTQTLEQQLVQELNRNDLPTMIVKKSDFQCQVPDSYTTTANKYGVYKDHCYSSGAILRASTPKKRVKKPAPVMIDNGVSDVSSLDKSDHGNIDSDYSLSMLGESTIADDNSVLDDDDDVIKGKKFVVFESELNELIKNLNIDCEKCGLRCSDVRKSYQGTMVAIKLLCSNDHIGFHWRSQPVAGKLPMFNLLFSAAIFFAGGTFESFKKPAEFVGLNFINQDTFYNIQRSLVLPAINDHFKESINIARNESSGKGVAILCDGRFDSPGKSAIYCTYNCQASSSGKIIATCTLQTEKGKGSAPLELQGYINCLEQLSSASYDIGIVATDRNKQIAKWTRINRPLLKHKYDPWHFVKNVIGKLRPLTKRKDCAILGEWMKAIANHLYFCADKCEGDPDKLVSMWKSILFHVTNRHKFKRSHPLYPACTHKKYTKAQAQRKKWIKYGSPAYNALEKVVLDKTNLADLPRLAEPYHTGSVEVFHSLINMYAPKSCEFDMHVMDGRVKLAVLDYNSNINRKQACVTRKRAGGREIGDEMWKVQFSKRTKEWVPKEVKESKSYQFVDSLLRNVIERKERGEKISKKLHDVEGLLLSPVENIAQFERPDIMTIISKKKERERFKK